MTKDGYADFLGGILAPSLHRELAHEVALGTIHALYAAGLVIVPLEPTEETLKNGARAICRQMGHDPDGNDADCRPDHESSDGWINWFWFKNKARVAHHAMIAAAGGNND